MDRIVEPELMDEADQAQAYAEADFSEPNTKFLEFYQEHFGEQPITGRVVDLGCGPAEIAFAMVAKFPDCKVIGVDGAPAMLASALERKRLGEEVCPGVDRLSFIVETLPCYKLDGAPFDVIISNSLLHHLHDPSAHWDTVKALGAPGTRVLVMDLFRPDSTEDADALVAKYAVGQPDVLRRDIYHSLLAAFRPDEIRQQLEDAGLSGFEVRVASDRHVLIAGEL